MSRTPIDDRSNCGTNGDCVRFGIKKGHWKFSLALIVIIFFDVGCSLKLRTVIPAPSVPIANPRTRHNMDSRSYNQDVCTSEECKRAASKLKEPMNLNVNPCEDFFEFACGNWQHEDKDWFTMKEKNLTNSVIEFLKKPVVAHEPKPVRYAKDLYKSCMDTDNKEQGVQAIRNFLKSVGLPPLPTFGSTKNTLHFDWLATAAKIRTKIYVDVLIGLTSKIGKHHSVKYWVLTVGPPEIEFMEYLRMKTHNNKHQIISSKKYVKEQITTETEQEEKKRYSNILKLFAKKTWTNSEQSVSDIQSEKFIKIDRDIKKMISEFQTVKSGNSKPDRSLAKRIVQNYLRKLSRATGVHIKTKVHIEQRDKSYLVQLAKYVAKTPPRELELYMWMKVVLALFSFPTVDFPDLMKDDSDETRSELCSYIVETWFNVPIRNEIKDLDITEAKINTMIHEVGSSLVDQIAHAKWMDSDTKLSSIEKIYQMKSLIGHIDSNKSYDEIYIDPSKHVLYNLINLTQALVIAEVRNLREAITCNVLETNEVNALFFHNLNCFGLSWGILQYPFYDLGLESLNYGALGFMIGHEMTHAFDRDGIRYDHSGNEHQWWTKNSTSNSYENILSCFVNQYSYYSINTLHVDGTQTLRDNMADNNGVRLAFAALKRHLNGQNPEPKLPGFEHLSSEKLFFLSYANSLCSKSSDEDLKSIIESDTHSPNRFRVNGALENNEDFAKAWNCKPRSYMNPINKCTLF